MCSSFEALIMLIETVLWAHEEDLDHIHCLLFNLAHQKGCIYSPVSQHMAISHASTLLPLMCCPFLSPLGLLCPAASEWFPPETCHFFTLLTLDLKAPPDLLSTEIFDHALSNSNKWARGQPWRSYHSSARCFRRDAKGPLIKTQHSRGLFQFAGGKNNCLENYFIEIMLCIHQGYS